MNSKLHLSPLSRGRFLLAGIVLFVIKIGLDFSVARAFGHAYSILYYVSPADAPLFHPGEAKNYYLAMWGVALPFIFVGVWLTLRRLVDAALSPSLAVLFFIPFANLLFFALCALAPSRPLYAGKSGMPEQPVYRESGQAVTHEAPERSPGAALFMSAGLGAVVGIGAMAISVGLLREYGAPLMCGAPTISGFATGAFFGRLDRKSKFNRAAMATILSCVITTIAIVAFAVEGAVCLVMAFPLLVAPAMFGAFLGFQSARAIPQKVSRMIAASVLSLPLLMLIERVNPIPPLHPEPVTTDIVIDAPPERVFPFVVRVDEMNAPTETFFRVGISYPMRATLDEDKVGAMRRCEFNTGTALEHVTAYDAPHHFAFHIDSQPDPMREATLYRGMRQPHLDGYVRNLEGVFDLEPLPGGKTRLIARSEYRVSMTPESYWRLWSDAVIHTIHRRVLTHVKARAEGRDPGTVAALDWAD